MFDLRSRETPAEADPVRRDDRRPGLRVLLAAPRGFCAGVHRAIDAVRDTLAAHGAPVYVRRPIVHNLAVVRELEAEGAVFVEEIDQVPAGATVVFSAHGVSPAIAANAKQRRLTAYDAVCPLVAKVHREVERHRRAGRVILLIGHRGHPEIEGTLGHVADGEAHVVGSIADVDALAVDRETPAAFAVQTTYSVGEADEIIAALRERFSDLVGPGSSDICYATTNRQNAAREVAQQVDAMIVVGEHFSSNACRLAEVAGAHCDSVQLIAEPGDLDWRQLPLSGAVGITAAASTPESSVEAVLAALEVRYRLAVEEIISVKETTVFKPMAVT